MKYFKNYKKLIVDFFSCSILNSFKGSTIKISQIISSIQACRTQLINLSHLTYQSCFISTDYCRDYFINFSPIFIHIMFLPLQVFLEQFLGWKAKILWIYSKRRHVSDWCVRFIDDVLSCVGSVKRVIRFGTKSHEHFSVVAVNSKWFNGWNQN